MGDSTAGQYFVKSPSFSDADPMSNPFVNPSERPFAVQRPGPGTASTANGGGGFAKVKERCEAAMAKMKENFNRMMDRGNRMETLLDKSDSLNQTTSQFNAQTRNIEREMWWKRWLVVAIAVAVVVLLMTALAFLNRFVFWLLLLCIFSGLCSIVYLHVQSRNRRLNPSMPVEVAMAVV